MSALGDALSRSDGPERASGTVTPPRAYQAAYEALEPQERPLLEQRLMEMTAEDFSALLTDLGFPISESAVGRYRRLLRRQKASSV